mmetsp:Transcript_26574/g.53335  ORF Transcript_26574/g.53335 Transcript_26574/m.53335 type:complete len:307 (+) Transcript_26574:1719-2639(+)
MFLSFDNNLQILRKIYGNSFIKFENFWKSSDFHFLIKKFLFVSPNLFIANSSQNGLKIFDVKKKKCLNDINPLFGIVKDFCLGSGLEILVSLDKSIFFYWKNTKNGYKPYSEVLLKNPMDKIIFIPSSNLIVTISSKEKMLYIWSKNQKRIYFSGRMGLTRNVTAIARSINSNHFAFGSSSGVISIFSKYGMLVNNFQENFFSKRPNHFFFTCLSWLNDEILIAGGTYKEITAWDIRTKGKIQTYKGHSSKVLNMEILDKNASGLPLFLSSDQNGILKMWDLRKQQEICSLKIPFRKTHSLGKGFV